MGLRRWLAVVASALAFFVICQAVQMVVGALPRIGRDVGLAGPASVWLLLAASLATVGLLLPAGRWADASGNRAAFLVATVGYSASALLTGLAPSLPVILFGRLLEGSFSAVILVLAMTVAVESAGPAGRGQAIGVVTAAGPLGSMTGPQLGALMLPVLGWRAVFLVGVPLMLVASAVAFLSVPGEVHLARPRLRWVVEAASLLIATSSLFLLLREVGAGPSGMLPAAGLLLLTLAAVAAWLRLPQAKGVFRLVAARHLALPLTGLAAMALIAGVVGYSVPFFLLARAHASLQATALAFIALAFGQTLSSATGGWALARAGSWPVAVVGAGLMTAGMLALVGLDAGWRAPDVAWRVALVGMGSGLVAGCNQSTVMGLAPWHHEAAASAISGLFRNLWYAFGAALAATLVATLPGGADLGLRLALALGLAAGVAAIVAAVAARKVMAGLDAHDREPVHHPVPHALHAALHRLDGLARDPAHPLYAEPEPLHPRAAVAAEG